MSGWVQALDGSELPQRLCELGSPGPLRDRLVGAVLRGEKTATSSLLVEWEQDEEPLPTAGERQTVIDSAGEAVGIIELVAVEVIRLGDADLRLAGDEGEGFAGVEQWREAHLERGGPRDAPHRPRRPAVR